MEHHSSDAFGGGDGFAGTLAAMIGQPHDHPAPNAFYHQRVRGLFLPSSF